MRGYDIVMGAGLVLAAAASVLCAGCASGPEETMTQQVAVREAHIESGRLSGRLLDNVANAGRQGSGFNPLCHTLYPGKSVYRLDFVGLNFEHIFNGAAGDKNISMFTPRKDPCKLLRESPRIASLTWPAESSSWGIRCKMTYQFSPPNAIDLTFKATPTVDRFPHGYAAFMWASYMNRTRERRIHFYGCNGGREGWMSFGDDLENGFETGTVPCAGIADLPYEEESQTLNLIEHPSKKFLKPFYYGLIDGDNDLTTADDTLAYIMMFDQAESIRFALWNFIQDQEGRSDPHSPAWDWQYVIRSPEPGKAYGYRARVVVKPFAGREDVEREYSEWLASLS